MIIAEIGSVHDGSLGNALKLIELASSCGADCVKFQYHISEEETLKDAPTPHYFNEESRYDYFKRIEFTIKEWKEIIQKCKKNNIKFMCSVFSNKSLDNLVKLGVQNIKIPSGELSNIYLINKLNNYKNLNLFISTGMSSWNDIDDTLMKLRSNKITLMQCTSMYPCPPDYVGINVILEMKKKYSKKFNVGFSDHTEGSEAAILAVFAGATIFEKHLTFSKKMYGSDAKFAMEPKEFSNYASSIKKAIKILVNPIDKNKTEIFTKMKKVFEKKLVLKIKKKKGEILRRNDLKVLKAKNGLYSNKIEKVIGKKIKKNLKINSVIKLTDFY